MKIDSASVLDAAQASEKATEGALFPCFPRGIRALPLGLHVQLPGRRPLLRRDPDAPHDARRRAPAPYTLLWNLPPDPP